VRWATALRPTGNPDPLASLSDLPRNEPTHLFRLYFFPTCTMSEQSKYIRFQAIFESSLETYKKNTSISLTEHPLTLQLQSCPSDESISSLLQSQIRASCDFEGNDRVKISIKSIIPILSSLSTSAAFDWSIGLVRQKVLMTCSAFPTVCFRNYHPEMRYMLLLPSYLLYVYVYPPFSSHAGILVMFIYITTRRPKA
jgi:hypothetical protein